MKLGLSCDTVPDAMVPASIAVLTRHVARSSMYAHYCGVNINISISYNSVVADTISRHRSTQA
jgi:hypothetical protein